MPLKKLPLLPILLLLLIINLVFGACVNLIGDEAYYWMYARNLDWGYFDHPPMIALWIKMGYSLIPTTLGVRLFPVLFNILGIYLLYTLAKTIATDLYPKQPIKSITTPFFSLIICSILYQIYGFIATPDSPLLFFTVLFLLLYYHHLKNASTLTTILLGIVGAALLYSKYHGILVIGFVLLSNLALFKQKQTYGAALLTFLLLIPHLYWQYSHQFPSILYHLQERHPSSYRLSFTLTYLINQLLIYSPLVFLAIFGQYQLKKQAQQTTIEPPAAAFIVTFFRACYFLAFGVFIFFCLMTFKGRVEDHWTAIACIPLLLIFLRWITAQPSLHKYLVKTALAMLVIFFAARILMTIDLLPNKAVKKRFFRGATWAKAIQKAANNQQVAFVNSYDQAARYAFYSGEESHSLNNKYWRKNQYDLWDYDLLMDGRSIFLITTQALTHYQAIDVGEKKPFYGHLYPNLKLFPRTNLIFDKNLVPTDEAKLQLPISIHHAYENPILLDKQTVFLTVHFMLDHQIIAETSAVNIKELDNKMVYPIPSRTKVPIHLEIALPEAVRNKQNIEIGMSLTTADIGPIRHRSFEE